MEKEWPVLEAMGIPPLKEEFNSLTISGGFEELKPNFTCYSGYDKVLELKFYGNWDNMTQVEKYNVLEYYKKGLHDKFPDRVVDVKEFKK